MGQRRCARRGGGGDGRPDRVGSEHRHADDLDDVPRHDNGQAQEAAAQQRSPAMIVAAIQRSQARSDKLRAIGRAEQFGSEEPFIFDPNK